MASLEAPLLEQRRGRDERAQGALIATLRHSLRLINIAFAVLGLAAVAYAAYLYYEVKHKTELHGYPWFIFAFGGAGILVFLTSCTALTGVAHNNRFCLGLYGILVAVLLIAQAALAIAFFADKSWRKHLPPDDTGNAKKVEKFLKHNLTVVRWVGLVILIIEVISILIAYSLSSAQQQLIHDASEDEDEIWGRRASLPRRNLASSSATVVEPAADPGQRQDPWSQRMRSKYGLDTSVFTYDPSRTEQNVQPASVPDPGQQQRKACAIM